MSQASVEMLERARNLGVNFKLKPANRIFITGFAQRTPLGNTNETWQGMLTNRSGVRKFREHEDAFVQIAAPIDFDPAEYFERRQLRGLSSLNALAIVLTREAAARAALIDEDGQPYPGINKNMFGSFVAAGLGSTDLLIDIHRDLHRSGDDSEHIRENSKHIRPTKSLEILPEQLNAAAARTTRAAGWSGSSVEACATGLGNPVEAAETIRTGRIDIAITGGLEDPFRDYPEVGRSIFSSMQRVLSRRNDEPEKASRPFDRDRDGFVEGAGGGIIVMENGELAISRGAPLLADVLGFYKSIDGGESQTDLDPDNVARTILQACWDEEHQRFHRVDAIFAHATSTKAQQVSKGGDALEIEAFRKAFGDELRNIPITAIKSYFGHLLGGAGAVNIIAAVQALNEGKIPPILNLENPDPDFADLYFVRGKPLAVPSGNILVVAYGFGGNNSAMLLGKVEKNAA